MTTTEIPFWQRLTCSIPEACQATGLGRSTVYGLMDSGTLQSRKIGRRHLVVVSSLQTLVAVHRDATGPGRSTAAPGIHHSSSGGSPRGS